MNTTTAIPADAVGTHDLVISRHLQAPRAALWRAWAEPALLAQWWCPRPWTTTVHTLDLRPGGGFHTHMQGPDGAGVDNRACFVEVVPQTRLVWTSLLSADWRPATPGMSVTAVVTLADEGAGTRYVVTAMHPDAATRDRHAALGFFAGWGRCIEQLAAVAQGLL